MKNFRKGIYALVLPLVSLFHINPAYAQEVYPAGPIELIVPWGPGGGADIMGRMAARWLESDLKTNVTVQNVPGATGSIGLNKMIQNGAKGYSIGVMTGDTLSLDAFPKSTFTYNDVIPLAVLIRQPSGLFINYDSPIKSWDDLVAAAKLKPNSINVAITGPNSPDESTVNYLGTKGVNLVSIPYPKPSERYVAVLGNQVELLYEQAGDIKGHLEAKKLRPLIFFASKRLPPPFADIPVSSDYGYDILLPQTRSIVAKKGVDPKKLLVLANSLNKLSTTTEFITYLKEQYAIPDSYIPMTEANTFLENELMIFKKLTAKAGK
ncbi:tripartite tricarboxylate transporter substrate binding protein [Polynucleobacter sp. IMCC 29146]|uniref:Bug family tripartite tricarboxylate transporter substrate binding protein n=1 Tax=Polynucleobacter sp. IMCC 29146 TaxID=2780953 RepID=UPI001F366150|nr:tripartite tricarboxylate transporter substrate binding protein [Polynucleobacter sp. IMCC 29146]MCE7530442.1 tripartite tricarboxylate transporter substrate binding protein [Polynucleobacter sp. IMCC 29146]